MFSVKDQANSKIQVRKMSMNFVSGILYVNLTFLPDEIKPGWGMRIGLALAGCYFVGLAALTLLDSMKWI
jgi:hypothetical protein